MVALLCGYVAYKLGWSRENLGLDDLARRANLAAVVFAALDAALLVAILLRRTAWRTSIPLAAVRWIFQGLVACVVLTILLEPPLQAIPVNLFRLGLLILLAVVLAFVLSARLGALATRWRGTPWFKALDILLFNVCVAFLLLELGTRVWRVVRPNPLTLESISRAGDRIAAYRPARNTLWMGFPVNSTGFVDREFVMAKDARTLRIVALGDSFAAGVVPYGANYLTLLEDILDHRAGGQRRVEVLNMGIPSISPIEYAHLLRTEGMRYKPDLVLVNFFVGNDFLECRRGAPTFGQRFASANVLKRVFRMLGEGLDASPPLESRTPGRTWYEDDAPSFSEDVHLAIESERIAMCRTPMPPLHRTYVDTALHALDEIVRTAPRVVLVAIPDEFQVNRSLQDEVLKGGGWTEAEFDFGLPQRILAEYARGQNLPFVDLLPALVRIEESEGRTYKPRDTHFNLRGNRVAASVIADALEPVLASLAQVR